LLNRFFPCLRYQILTHSVFLHSFLAYLTRRSSCCSLRPGSSF
jgi:hypothetical protein